MFPQLSKLDPQDPNYAVDVVDALLPIAVARGASDIHLQPRESGWEILLRVDGVLSPLGQVRGGGSSDPVARLMVLAGLPTYRSSQPMEGRLQWNGQENDSEREPTSKIENGTSMRIGVFPTVHGPRAVIRLLRHDASFDTIPSLGMPSDLSDELAGLCEATDGAILLTGPAGSGKTTTMYAMLRQIADARPQRSVVTIEDPVETVIDSISQSELDPSGGMTLSSALKSAVRQDSEVLLVSEIRDPATAEAALQASLTGHLVFSSLHASDVASTMRRLVQLGVPHYVVQSGLRAIVSQRLVRRICDDCQGADRQATVPSSSNQHETNSQCGSCMGSGYRGRMAIAQCVKFDGSDPVGEALAESLEAGASVEKMRRIAGEAGGSDLWRRGQQCVDEGLTDMDEIYRVLGRNPSTVSQKQKSE